MRTWHKIVTEAKVLSGAKRNRMDLLRHLVRRPALLAAMAAYEVTLLLSSRAEGTGSSFWLKSMPQPLSAVHSEWTSALP